MTEYVSIQSSRDVIQHFGTKGMRWGHRKSKEFYTKKYIGKGYNPRAAREKAERRMVLNKRLKTGAKIAGGVALAGLAAYGAYKGYGHLKANADRIAANNLAIRQRNEAIRKAAQMRSEKMDKEFDALHKRGKDIQDLFRKRGKEAEAIFKDFEKSNRNYSSNSTALSTVVRSSSGRRLKDVTNSLR